jgi:formylglycine-generating enzyme required for sulfatase activity
MSVWQKFFLTGVLLTFVPQGTAWAEGPTAAEPVSWQKAGEGIHVIANNPDVGNEPTWIDTWGDSSGHGNRVIALHWAQSPRLKNSPDTMLNGHAIMGFGKTQGTRSSNALVWYAGSPLYGAEGGTGFIVVQVFDTAGGGQVWHFGSGKAPNEWSGKNIPFVWENFGCTDREMLINDEGMSRLNPPSTFRSGALMKAGRWYIYAVTVGKDRQGDVEMKGYINGILKGKKNIGLTMGWGPTAIIGDQGDGKTEMNVAELLLYDRVLSPTEMNAVTAYLGEKFGLCVAPPGFDVDGGVYKEAQSVTITCATPGAKIRYTTDGTDPSETNGQEIAHGESIEISSDTILLGRAWRDGLPPSDISKGIYTFAPIPTKGLRAWAKAGFGVTFEPDHENWVTGWLDASGNEKNMVALPGRPLYRPGELNGQPILGFGTGQGTTCCDMVAFVGNYHTGRYGFVGPDINPLAEAEAATGFIVIRGFLNNKSPPYGGQFWNMGSGGPILWNPPEIRESFGVFSHPAPVLIKDPSLKFGEWYVYAVTVGGGRGKAVMKGYLNGELKGQVGGLTVQFYEIGIGDHNPVAKNATSVFNMAEVMLYDRVLSDDELGEVAAYLGEKFGIEVKVGPKAAGPKTGKAKPGATKDATPKDTDTLTILLPGDVPLEMVRIPAGEFVMGSKPGSEYHQESEAPAHKVHINHDFYLGKYEVTQAQWMAVLGANPSTHQNDLNRPVENAGWNKSQTFIKALNKLGHGTFRLPSEAEWEYACRGGTSTPWSFGDDPKQLADSAWHSVNWGTEHQAHAVGAKPPNPFGLHDMHGNMWEWVQDWYHPDYTGAPTDGSAWNDEDPNWPLKVLRGGAWYVEPSLCRSAYRNVQFCRIDYPDHYVCTTQHGLRLARDL